MILANTISEIINSEDILSLITKEFADDFTKRYKCSKSRLRSQTSRRNALAYLYLPKNPKFIIITRLKKE